MGGIIGLVHSDGALRTLQVSSEMLDEARPALSSLGLLPCLVIPRSTMVENGRFHMAVLCA